MVHANSDHIDNLMRRNKRATDIQDGNQGDYLESISIRNVLATVVQLDGDMLPCVSEAIEYFDTRDILPVDTLWAMHLVDSLNTMRGIDRVTTFGEYRDTNVNMIDRYASSDLLDRCSALVDCVEVVCDRFLKLDTSATPESMLYLTARKASLDTLKTYLHATVAGGGRVRRMTPELLKLIPHDFIITKQK